MLRIFGRVCFISTCIVIAVLFLSCGDVQEINPTQPEEFAAINKVLKEQWQKGYMTENLDLYLSAYWEDGFLYTSDVGTDNDPSDDVAFDDIRKERDSAIRVFQKFQDIEIEISEPPEIKPNADHTKAEVRNHYKIQGFVADGTSLEGGYTGFYAEGDSTFTFELRNNPKTGKNEWRITVWKDEAYSPEEIKAANNL